MLGHRERDGGVNYKSYWANEGQVAKGPAREVEVGCAEFFAARCQGGRGSARPSGVAQGRRGG
eukprot:13217202-Alexandrium_andersonii.AAC.1